MLPILNLYEMTLNNIPYVLHEHSLTFEMLPQLWSYDVVSDSVHKAGPLC